MNHFSFRYGAMTVSYLDRHIAKKHPEGGSQRQQQQRTRLVIVGGGVMEEDNDMPVLT